MCVYIYTDIDMISAIKTIIVSGKKKAICRGSMGCIMASMSIGFDINRY